MKEYLQLGKVSIILPVSFTAFTGYVLFHSSINLNALLVTLAVFLLGIASSALNQIQEKDKDAMMERTSNRPLSSEKLPVSLAYIFVLFSFIAGNILLFFFGNLTAVFLGIFTIVWYNGLYTPLKRKTAFAVIPGSLTGAMPPMIGWTAAGGAIMDYHILLLAFILFMGQIPHFWLLINMYGEQCRKAGFPNLSDIFESDQIKRLNFIWIIAAIFCALLLPLFSMENPIYKYMMFCLVSFFSVIFIIPLFKSKMKYKKMHFILLNSFFLVLMIILILDELKS